MKAILTASIFAVSACAASACEFQRSVEAKTDPTVVASIMTGDAMSTPVLPVPAPEEAAVPAPEQN